MAGWVKNITDIKDDDLFGEHDPIVNNLYGNIYVIRDTANYWKKHGDPKAMYSMVSVSSYNGIRGCPGCSLYGASKHGIIALVTSVAQEFL
mmetsp:Transcript_85035/g.127466  ORF Transcript_85035/g.127466 Transcript_85035/m.127466 type:complete len:91 (+) Transcript_85035:220-492(+)